MCKQRVWLSRVIRSLFLVWIGVLSSAAAATTPFLAFSDLISGPDTGLGDGKGSGVIVTVWGTDLGSSQGENKLIFKDSSGKTYEPYVYYWKNADGQLPSGPANLSRSHGMQEVAFSIPDSAAGSGEIYVQVGSARSNVLPFTVRTGDIFHVSSRGSDSNSGTFQSPWRTVGEALDSAPEGSTTYVQDVDTGSVSSPPVRAIYWRNETAKSSLDRQFAITAYPGFQPKAIAQKGVETYKTAALVVSKLDIYSSNYRSVDSNGQPSDEIHDTATFGIQSSRNGRAVANRIGDIPGGCASSVAGAIAGGATYDDYVSNFKALGNEIYDYGCNGSDKLHHTTYMTIRSGPENKQLAPWEFGFNYLHGNKAKFGIHQFDQNSGCGDLTSPLRIYNNVIVDQGGAGISIGSQCDWSMDAYIENNVLINVGLAADWDGIDPMTSDGAENGGISIRDSGLLGTMYIRNNTVYRHSMDRSDNDVGCLALQGSGDNVSIVWSNNICVAKSSEEFVGAGYRADAKMDNITGTNNIWFAPDSTSFYPTWDKNGLATNPELEIVGDRILLNETSPAVDSGAPISFSKDVYGNRRDANPDIGAVEYETGISPPLPPSNITIELN